MTDDGFVKLTKTITEFGSHALVQLVILTKEERIRYKGYIGFYDDENHYLTVLNGMYYEVLGIIFHLGASTGGGHYITWALDRVSRDQRWIEYDDQSVRLKNWTSERLHPQDQVSTNGIATTYLAMIKKETS